MAKRITESITESITEYIQKTTLLRKDFEKAWYKLVPFSTVQFYSQRDLASNEEIFIITISLLIHGHLYNSSVEVRENSVMHYNKHALSALVHEAYDSAVLNKITKLITE